MSRRIIWSLGAFLLLSALANPASAQVKTKAAAHDLAGKENCMMCHTPGVMEPVPDTPASHEGRVNEQCGWCHAPGAAMVTTGAKQTPHDIEGKDNCLMCHTAGAMAPVPDMPAESHEGRANENCQWCHTKAGG